MRLLPALVCLAVLNGNALEQPRPVLASADQATARRGIVRLADQVFIDDTGPFLGVGATLFWAGWGYQHDRARLEQNLDFLAKHGVDYIRVLGVVGPRGWPDRTVAARSLLEGDAIQGLTDLAYSKGMRVEWTIFGGLDTTPTARDREALVRRFASALDGRAHKVQHFEVVNEGYSTGWRDNAEEAKHFARLLRELTPNLVAVSAPPELDESVKEWYEGSNANLLTVHVPRDVKSEGGLWRPVRDARDPMLVWSGAWTSNEPIGIASSVASDDDPLRIAMAAAVTWLCRGAGYVVHSGAGIQGGGESDVARGRVANVFDQPTLGPALDLIEKIRALLPADLPNFEFQNANANFPRYPFEIDAIVPLIESGRLFRAFAATAADGRFVMMPLVAKAAVPFRATRAMEFDVILPGSGFSRSHMQLRAGDTFTLTPTPAAIVVGRLL